MKAGGIGVFEIWNSPPIRKIQGKGDRPGFNDQRIDGTVIRRERGFKLRDDASKSVVEVNYRYTIQDGSADRRPCGTAMS